MTAMQVSRIQWHIPVNEPFGLTYREELFSIDTNYSIAAMHRKSVAVYSLPGLNRRGETRIEKLNPHDGIMAVEEHLAEERLAAAPRENLTRLLLVHSVAIRMEASSQVGSLMYLRVAATVSSHHTTHLRRILFD